MNKPLSCLLVEDSEDDALLVLRQLRGAYTVTSEETAEAMRAALGRQNWDIVISDYSMPHFSGLAALELLQASGMDLPFIIVSGTIGEEVAVEAMKAGAHDYIMKGKLARLVPAVERELIEAAMRRDRQRMEADMIASEARYRRLFESTKDGILILNAETGMVVDVNPFLIEALSFSREQFLGKKIWDLEFFKDIVGNKARFAELQRNEYVRYEDKPLETADGRRIDVEFVSNVYRVNGHRVMQCNIRDITARRLADEELRREQAFFKDLANTIPDHIYFKDRQSRFVRINEAMTRSFGLGDAAEAVGKTDSEIFSKEHAQKAYADEQQIIRTGEPMIAVEEKETWPDGHITWVSTTKMPLRDAQGCITGIVGISRDITEKRQLEEQALRAQRLENLGLLAGGIAHDLNNALAPIIMAGPLLHQYVSDPSAQRMLGIIEQSSMRGAALVRQMVSFARGSGTEMQLVQASRVLREVIDLGKSTFSKSIQIESRLPNDLWPVMSDPTKLEQVFVNLLVNARDAMPDGGELTLSAANRTLDAAEAVKISPEARPGDFLAVEVRDTGTGIAPEVMEKIWEPFFTTKREGKGTGLGLSTVRSIVRQHNGFVTLQTSHTLKSSHGSTFTVYLPAANGERKSEASAHLFESQLGNGELILVVDDEKPVCELTSKILTRFGYKVMTASDGVEAIAAFVPRSEEVRLLITDMEMPIVNGLALAAALRRLKPDLSIVAMSGGNSPSDEVHKQFATAFLAKPFESETLLSIVHHALEAPLRTPPRT